MQPLLDVRNLTVAVPAGRGAPPVRIIDDISYSLEDNQTLGIVGESGSGKSMQALAMLGLLPPRSRALVHGEVMFQGHNLLSLSDKALRAIRGAQIGMIFQEPMTSLNPVLTIGRQLAEPLVHHLGMSHAKARRRAVDLLGLVGIADPARRVRQYPFQFSGGMRQRVMIAMAIACKPKLLIGDEPTTALDVTIQAQIIALIRDLRDEMKMSIIWITHDMGVVAAMADSMQVLYAGKIMETGPVERVFSQPHSAYTWSLLQSIPGRGQRPRQPLFQIAGQPVDPARRPPGDPFAPRNPFATARCFLDAPPLRPVSPDEPRHRVAAWYDLPRCLADLDKDNAT
ncbi:ABC transporter ATP-binding protein [Sodalis sp. RH24]|uniref:ABC transporter ATP-binding protein n=1 Tax=unclassified Sodalis (in: enterobacteria) TaxID=2636512 RepID=UPI003965B4E8